MTSTEQAGFGKEGHPGREAILDHLLGMTSPDESDRMEKHLSQCPECGKLSTEMKALEGLPGILAAEPSSETNERIRNALDGAVDRLSAPPAAGPSRARFFRVSIAACLAMAAGAVSFILYRTPGPPDRAVAHVTETSPGARILRGTRTLAAADGMPLVEGDRVETETDGRLRYSYEGEDTGFEVFPNTAVELGRSGEGKHLHVRAGRIEGTVAPQPEGRPLSIGSPHIEVRVLGTRLSVAVTNEWSAVRVLTGSVRVRANESGREVSVSQGTEARAGGAVELAVVSLPPAIAPVPKEEKARILRTEDAAQKELRAELDELGRKGQKIAFSSDCDGVHRIYLMDPGGSDIRCLTPWPENGGRYPRISPGGGSIVFTGRLPHDPSVPREPPAQKVDALCLMSMNGNAAVRPLAVGGGYGHWSPDGRKIVYQVRPRRSDFYICVFDLETNREKVILGPPAAAPFPFYTPDGKYVVFGGARTILPAEPAGNDVSKSPGVFKGPWENGGYGTISPDGKWLAWAVDTDGDSGGRLMYAPFVEPPAAPAAAAYLKLKGESASIDYFPDFSPCGKYLVYAHGRRRRGLDSYDPKSRRDLYITRFPDCDVSVRITWNNAGNCDPHWWGPKTEAVVEK
jgi:hypothetical protein